MAVSHLCGGRNWEAVTAKIQWDGSKKRPSRSLNQLYPKQKITAAEKEKEIEALAANPKERASQIQKVSAQVEMSRPAPQTLVRLSD
jgi:hypothetical protein